MLWFRHLVPFAILAVLAVTGFMAYQEGQRHLDSWLRLKLTQSLAEENLRADIGSMTLDPLRGLVARNCRLYGGREQNLLLATFDHLRVEADLSRLLQRQQFINSVELAEASLALPLDPEDPQTQWLTLTRMKARVTASGDRFELHQASGLLEGVPVAVEGTLLKPSRLRRERSRPPGEKGEALDVLRERRHWLDELRQQLRHLNWQGSTTPPQLNLQITGDLDRPAELRVRARLRGEEFRYRDYTVKELDVSGEWSRGEAVIQEARLRDTAGTLVGAARLVPGQPGFSFNFHSSANLPALIGAIQEVPALREFILYEPDSLTISGEGSWRPAVAEGGSPAALNLIGRLSSGRFATRGIVFQSIDASFYFKENDLNLRDLRLAHESGTLDGQVMRQNGLWRYQTQMRMNPKAIKPFLTTAALRRQIDRFDFQDHSTLELEAHGSGRTESPESWQHHATVDARQFRYQGEIVRRLQAGLTHHHHLTTANNVRLVRPEGEITAHRLTFENAPPALLIEGLHSTVFPVPILQSIAPRIVRFVEPYRFTQPPVIKMNGRVGLKRAEPNDFTIDLTSKGEVAATLPDRHVLPLLDPRGQITSKGLLLSLDLSGQVRAGTSWRGTTLDEAVAARFLGAFPIVPTTPRSESWQFFLTGPARARQLVGSVTLPVEISKTTVDFRHRRADTPGATVQVEADGRLLAPADFHQLRLLSPAPARFQGIFETPKNQPANDRTRWNLTLAAPGPVEWKIANTSLPLENVQLEANFRRNRLDFPKATARLLGGTLTGSGEIDHLSSTQDFIAAVQAEGVAFGSLAKIYAPETNTAGQLAGGFRLAGRGRPGAGESLNLRGAGQATIRDGDIFALPLLGPLSPLLSTMLPGTKTGYSKAREARASFSLNNGVLTTRDFEALTMAFVIKGGGEINLNSKRVDLQARVNTRGPTGMLLYPVSRLLEYQADGTTSDPSWTPGVLSLPGRLLPLPNPLRR